MTEDMQVRKLSPRAQATYILQVSLFARHLHRSPEAIGLEQQVAQRGIAASKRKLAFWKKLSHAASTFGVSVEIRW
jgi:hypothetical protein